MKRTTIVRIAEWTGWCGPCAAERPLVLTRTGRHSLRSWIAGSDGKDRPLTLTCRLCGVGVVVPAEADDPEVEVPLEPVSPFEAGSDGLDAAGGPVLEDLAATTALAEALPPLAPTPVAAAPVLAAPAPVPLAPAVLPTTTTAPTAEVGPSAPEPALQAARQEMATALSHLLARRSAVAPITAAVLPQQRSGEVAAPDGLQALQLLAEGLDLLSTRP